MSAETLLTAAHRLNRFFRIDMKRGGLVVDETLAALETLEAQTRGTDANPADALLTAAKDVTRCLRLDTSDHGGMVAIRTEIAFDTLDKAIRAKGGRKAEAPDA
ncbi:hypothetical protein ACUXK4_004848 [Methylorubrum extorquens]